MKRAVVTETQVAEVVVAYLEALGADVYQEVEVSGGVADIVARVQAEIWIVEVKTSLCLRVIGQAMERRRLAHRVFVAAPQTRRLNTELFAELGIGVLEVTVGVPGLDEFYGPKVREVVSSRRWNRRPVALAADLKPEHKTHAKAGSAKGGRWTPFRATIEEFARVVHAQPGISLKAAIAKTKHHYRTQRTALSALAHWVERGKVPGVELRRSHGTHGPLELHPKAAT